MWFLDRIGLVMRKAKMELELKGEARYDKIGVGVGDGFQILDLKTRANSKFHLIFTAFIL